MLGQVRLELRLVESSQQDSQQQVSVLRHFLWDCRFQE